MSTTPDPAPNQFFRKITTVLAVPTEVQDAARHYVASCSRDAEDCRLLLDMLGLL